MVRILYGVTGQGAGHSTRSKETITHLLEAGHEVKVISYDRGFINLSPFFDVTKVFGLGFVYENNAVHVLKTLRKNILNLPEAKRSLLKVLRLIKEFKPQIVFTDFEPLTCLVSQIKRLPLISIDNQHLFTNVKIKYPRKYLKDALATNAVVRGMVFYTKANIVTSFFDAPVRNKKTFIVPPIVRREIIELKPEYGSHVLVYLSSGSDKFIPLLRKIDENFVVYGLDRDDTEGNIIYKKFDQESFLHDLGDCKAIIANAGFSLISEALYLKKPYYVVPIAKQFEQIFNAYMLDKLGLGKFEEEPSAGNLKKFFSDLEKYRQKLESYPREDNTKLFAKVDELIAKWARRT